jgi:hypothetical protein
MDYTDYDNVWGGLIGPDISDTLTPGLGAISCLHNDVGDVVGLRWPGLGAQGAGRLVLLTCPLDAVPISNGVNDRIHFLRNVLAFLAPGASGVADVAFDSSGYNLPSVVTVEVGDADRAGTGTVSVNVSSTTEPSGLNLTLLETSAPGVFDTSFVLLSSTNPPTAGKLRAKNGDDLTLKYFDASAGTYVIATAMVDTNPPTISNTEADPDYELATIYWETSEPADSLVQFGESPLLGRTAYSGDPTTDHAVTLFGLVPNRRYYYQVVSRDVSGNTVTDDNHGSPYFFDTLIPRFAPWSDDMNTGATNWSVYTADDSQSEWTLGVPNNGLETAAHSPPAAWGSNLNGNRVDYVETFLISPAIYLNGNTAKLQFWHSYDFTGGGGDAFDIELGQVQIVYNHGSSIATLAEFDDYTDGWEPVDLILTPYAGQVVYLIWYYAFFSFDSTTLHPGWLVDDVSVTVSNEQPGTIVITNNISQGGFILSETMYRKAKGFGTVISNAPPGPYVCEFSDVPYYITPVAQTNTLASGALLTFQGNYTFDDANHNGMSDAWESAYFGSVSPARTASTDTDGDRMTDLAEFIAGTNPTNAASKLVATAAVLPNGAVRLTWQAGAGHGYRVVGSSDGTTWTPFSVWLRAAGNTRGFTLPPRTNGAPYLFRIEAWQ